MPEPNDLPPLPEPFPQPGSTPVAPPPSRQPGGCGKWALIGCGVAVLGVFLVGVVLVSQQERLFAWALSLPKRAIVDALPSDVTADERRRLEAAFDAILEANREQQLQPDDISRLQRVMTDAVNLLSDGLTREEVLGLTEQLERVLSPRAPDGSTARVEPPGLRPLGGLA